ncbi:cyclin-like protein [Entophlyctis helioformis]|nr:cyclin-like protein [Entophlyctis helioformis]
MQQQQQQRQQQQQPPGSPSLSPMDNGDWLYSESAFLTTPSALQGVPPENEAGVRLRACRFIERCARKLRVPHDLMATSKVLLQRFYMRSSVKDCEYHDVASSLLFLSCKLGEGRTFKRIEEVVSVCGSDAKKSPVDVSEGSKEFLRWKDTIMHYEEHALHQLCYDLSPGLPHHLALGIVRDHQGSLSMQKLAFFYCEEALCTTLVLRFPALQIAQAAVHAACLTLGETIHTLSGQEWWAAGDLDLRRLKAIAYEMSLAADEAQLRRLVRIRMSRFKDREFRGQRRRPKHSGASSSRAKATSTALSVAATSSSASPRGVPGHVTPLASMAEASPGWSPSKHHISISPPFVPPGASDHRRATHVPDVMPIMMMNARPIPFGGGFPKHHIPPPPPPPHPFMVPPFPAQPFPRPFLHPHQLHGQPGMGIGPARPVMNGPPPPRFHPYAFHARPQPPSGPHHHNQH